MLGKLFKHEFKATGRHFLLMYLVFFAITFCNKLFLEFSVANNRFWSCFQSLFMLIYGLTCAAIFVITAVLIVNRFYKNLMCDEGYLMFTLPVTINQHIIVKAIVAFVWSLLSTVIFFISIIILACGHGLGEFFSELGELIAEVTTYYSGPFYLFLILTIIGCIIGVLFSILQAYLAIAIGQLVNKHRVLTSFAAYFAINFAIQTLSTFALVFVGSRDIDYLFLDNLNSKTEAISAVFQYINAASGISLVFSVVLGTIFFFVTSFILSKKLNLE